MKMELITQTLDADDLVLSPDGYLVIEANVGRTGIQYYRAYKLGLEGDPNRLVPVYRSEEEVASPESLASYAHKPIVNEHPIFSKGVYSDNVQSLQHGEISTDAVLTDDGHIRATLWFKTREIIDEIIGGKRSLSLGYFNKYEKVSGIAPDGTPYEYIQTGIRINHLAVCYDGRAGESVSIPVPEEFTTDSSDDTFYAHGITNDEAIASDNDESEITSDESSPIREKELKMTTDTNPKLNLGDLTLTLDSAENTILVQDAFDKQEKAHKEIIQQMTTDHETALGLMETRATKAEDALKANENTITRDSVRAEMVACDAIVATAKSHGVELLVTDSSTERTLKQEFVTAMQKPDSAIKYTADTADETINAVYDALTVDSNPKNPLGDIVLDSKGSTDATTLVTDSRDAFQKRIASGQRTITTPKGDV